MDPRLRSASRLRDVALAQNDSAVQVLGQADMKDKYKETARGGLARNVVEC